MFPFLIPLIGAAGGALLNKDNPLKGAAIGGGLGALGGFAAPGLLGTPAVAGAATPGIAGAAAPAASAPATGLLGTLGQVMQPVGQAANAAMTTKSLLGPEEELIPAPQIMPPMPGNNSLSAIATQGQQAIAQQMQMDAEKRAARRKMFGGM